LISFNSNNLRNTTKKLDIKFYKNLKYQKNFFIQLIEKQWHLICTVIHIVSLTTMIVKTCQMQYRICYLLKMFIYYCVRKASVLMHYKHCLKCDMWWCRSMCLILGITLVTWTFGAILGWCYLHSSTLWPEKNLFLLPVKTQIFIKILQAGFFNHRGESTGRQLPPLSSVLYRIISRRRYILAAQLLLREKSGT
jgi:hypothetical protein